MKILKDLSNEVLTILRTGITKESDLLPFLGQREGCEWLEINNVVVLTPQELAKFANDYFYSEEISDLRGVTVIMLEADAELPSEPENLPYTIIQRKGASDEFKAGLPIHLNLTHSSGDGSIMVDHYYHDGIDNEDLDEEEIAAELWKDYHFTPDES